MMTTLNKIAELTDPKAIAAEFKKLPQKEAIAVALQCAIDWVDDGDFMEQIMGIGAIANLALKQLQVKV